MVARLDRVDKRYGQKQVFHQLSLTVEAGELLALVGRSGSGKSTLLHILGGLDRDYAGAVEVLGRDLGQLDDRALSRLRNAELGFVFQSFHLLEHLDVAENVAVPSYFADAGGGPAERRARVEEALERVGMTEHASSRPLELSGGQRQRVAIARALFMRPRLLLADEPTGNLDEQTGREIIELFRRLNRDGLTLIIVTHEQRVSEVASRVLELSAGRLEPPAAEHPGST